MSSNGFIRWPLLVWMYCVCFLTTPVKRVDACSVLDHQGINITKDVVVFDSDASSSSISSSISPWVNCSGARRCRNFVIQNCKKVKCMGHESCQGAQMVPFLQEVICDGPHACYGAVLQGQPKIKTETKKKAVRNKWGRKKDKDEEDINLAYRNVVCQGRAACDAAVIIDDDLADEAADDDSGLQVLCLGAKACQQTNITLLTQKSSVTCTQGNARYPACQGSATIITPCLYCDEPQGCASTVQDCRYAESTKLSTDYIACRPNSVLGKNCPVKAKSTDFENENNDDENNG